MSAYSTNREYDASRAAWSRARDVLAGEDALKAAGTKYLPRMDSQSDEQYEACRFCKELCVNGFSFWFLFSVVVISRASRSELERAGGRAASP